MCRLWEREGKKTKEQGREAPEGQPQVSRSVALILWLPSLPRGILSTHGFLSNPSSLPLGVRVLGFGIVPIDLRARLFLF